MAEKMRVLVVDDAEENRKLLKSFLFFFGLDADTASDGLEAKAALSKNPYPLVVSDIEMPNMNGFELLAWIRKNPSFASMPVVMLSTLDTEDVIARCKKLGANAYVVKPFTKDKIEKALDLVGLKKKA